MNEISNLKFLNLHLVLEDISIQIERYMKIDGCVSKFYSL